MFHLVAASHLIFTSVEEMADLAEQSEDADEGLQARPQVEIILLPLEAHEALRDCGIEELDAGGDEPFHNDNSGTV